MSFDLVKKLITMLFWRFHEFTAVVDTFLLFILYLAEMKAIILCFEPINFSVTIFKLMK